MATTKKKSATKKAATTKAAGSETAAAKAPPKAAAKGAAPRKAAPKKAAAKKAAPRKEPAIQPAAAAALTQRSITPEDRWHMISTAAYFIAEKRGFSGGDPAQDWAEAERQIDDLLTKQNTVVGAP